MRDRLRFLPRRIWRLLPSDGRPPRLRSAAMSFSVSVIPGLVLLVDRLASGAGTHEIEVQWHGPYLTPDWQRPESHVRHTDDYTGRSLWIAVVIGAVDMGSAGVSTRALFDGGEDLGDGCVSHPSVPSGRIPSDAHRCRAGHRAARNVCRDKRESDGPIGSGLTRNQRHVDVQHRVLHRSADRPKSARRSRCETFAFKVMGAALGGVIVIVSPSIVAGWKREWRSMTPDRRALDRAPVASLGRDLGAQHRHPAVERGFANNLLCRALRRAGDVVTGGGN